MTNPVPTPNGDADHLRQLRSSTEELRRRLAATTPREVAAAVAWRPAVRDDDDAPAPPPGVAHDPMVCGLDGDGISPTCPGCIAEAAAPRGDAARTSAGLRVDLLRVAERFETADRRARTAAMLTDREAAEAERREAAGEFHAGGSDLADLLLLLLRMAARHEPDALRTALVELLRPELAPLVSALARLEGRRR